MRRSLVLLSIISCSLSAGVPSFENFQEILNKHLVENKQGMGLETHFKYAAAHDDEQTKANISEQAETLKTFQPDTINTKEEATAFWVNSYNFFMIKKILTDGFKKNSLSIEGVKDLGHFFNPYAVFGEDFANIGGSLMSLDDMEKGWLLSASGKFKNKYKEKNWKDARIHFAVNCASVGCPALQKKVFDPDTIDSELDRITKLTFKTPRHLHFQGDTLRISALFKWYEEDFTNEHSSKQKYIASFIEEPALKQKILDTKDIEFIKYNWSLNTQNNFEKSNAKKDWLQTE